MPKAKPGVEALAYSQAVEAQVHTVDVLEQQDDLQRKQSASKSRWRERENEMRDKKKDMPPLTLFPRFCFMAGGLREAGQPSLTSQP